MLVDNNGTFGRLSYLYQPDDLTKKSLPGAPGLSTKIGMRIDKTLSAEHGFLDARVYITNNTEESIDVVYVTQDAAYMFLPDGNQKKVIPLIKIGQTEHDRQYYYGELSPGDVVATYHETQGFAGGYVVQQGKQVFGGVVPEYAFFTSHYRSNSLPGFADVHRHGFKDIESLNRYLVAISESELEAKRLKNRILVFSFPAVEPGDTVVAWFYQVGGGSLGEMNAQIVDATRAR